MNQVKALALVGDLDGCALWRVLLPFSELQRQGFGGFEWGNKDDDRLGLVVDRFNVVVLPRLHWLPEERARADRWFRALHNAGITVVYEVDDDMFSADFEQRLLQMPNKGKGEVARTPEQARIIRESILNTLQQADGVTVSSQRLATIVSRLTDKPIRVVPNYIDLRWWGRIQHLNRRTVPGLTVGWAGGFRPDSDVVDMATAWGRLARRYPDLIFVVQGHHAPPIYDQVPNDRIAALDWLPIDSYPAGIKNIDIGCCPLANTPFNRAKTPIKAMEYAASGAAVVASPTVYGQIVEHGVDGYVVEGADAWEQALSGLVESEERRRAMATALKQKVARRHSLQANAWRWVEAWTTIMAGQPKQRIALPAGGLDASFAS